MAHKTHPRRRLDQPSLPAPDLRALEDPKTHPGLRKFVRAILVRLGGPGQGLDDLVAEVVGEAAVGRDGYDPALASVATWLESIARHRLIDFQRRWRAKESHLVLDQGANERAVPASPQLNPEQAAHAHQLLGELDSAVTGPAREPFLLHAEGYSLADIAKKTGLLPGQVKERLEKAGRQRDRALARTGEDKKRGTKLRFGVLPLLLAFEQRAETSPGSSEPAEATPSGSPALGLPPAPPRTLSSRLVAAATVALVLALAVPLASGRSTDRDSVVKAAADAEPLHVPAPAVAPVVTTGPHAATVVVSPPPGSPLPAGRGGLVAKPLPAPPRSPRTVAVPPDGDTDVRLRLAGAAARAGSPDTALTLLDEHARQFPATDPAMTAGLVREARARRSPRR